MPSYCSFRVVWLFSVDPTLTHGLDPVVPMAIAVPNYNQDARRSGQAVSGEPSSKKKRTSSGPELRRSQRLVNARDGAPGPSVGTSALAPPAQAATTQLPSSSRGPINRNSTRPGRAGRACEAVGLPGMSDLSVATTQSSPMKSSPSVSMTATAEAREQQLFAHMGKPRQSKAMDTYFFDTPSTYEAKIPKPTEKLGTEAAMKQMADAIKDVTGDRRLVGCGNSGSPIKLAPDRGEQENTPDAVILTHAAVAAAPDLPFVWAQSEHPTSMEGTPSSPQRAYSQIAVAIEVKKSDKRSAEARNQVIRRLHMICTTALRAHAIGVTLCGDVLQVYLVNACGVFTTSARECGQGAVLLRRVLSHLIELDDNELGMLASTNEVDDGFGSFVVSDKFLPPRAHDFESELGDISDLEIQELLFRRRSCLGRATSAFRVTARHAPVDRTSITLPTPATEYAMTVAWVEQSRLDDAIALRRNMHAASRIDTEGLSLSAGIYRDDFRTLPTFLGDDESFDDIGPRALEVVFHRQCYRPLNTATTTRELAQAVLGVVKGEHRDQLGGVAFALPSRHAPSHDIAGHRNLYRLGYIHRDISYGNAVIDRDGVGALIDYHLAVPHDRLCTELHHRIRSGTWPYLACSILAQPNERLGVVHERWHDIESLFYVVMEVSFREPYQGNNEELVMTPKGETIWRDWNRPEAHVVYAIKDRLRKDEPYESVLEGCAHRWTNIKQLVDILRHHCGLDNQFYNLKLAAEEAKLGELWGPSGTMSHEAIISEIERLIPLL
ncbi:BZ3500_MvSof-1268-A1-R1_Chr11-3g03622 [Microbotryum saponariae]|uniref:BZ3500_MvSof-1268-A1-R1_Chr11-3g03622 protein n=1 Tax=Microbotryum saponariae TaxID=289078 RepID=A0A2X0KTQ7_9BASI|nr:BZ3500_MvSof-1268-A1-R1_Chr11-3g03622 [Microbotryum saponariae]SDA03635.1 BZ3501_MvSof-1269-A2-R1_Chr11g03199 [Microbotryum saponariae]